MKLTKIMIALAVLAIVVTVSISVVSSSTGNSYYTSPDGNNSNSGLEKSPWRTIQYAVDQANPGDTIYVMDGTYKERIILHKSGTNSTPITIKNAPGAAPVIDGKEIKWKDQSWGALFQFNGHDYWVVEGLHIQNAYAQGFGDAYGKGGSRNITIRKSTVTDAGGPGFYFRGSKNLLLDENTATRTNKGLGLEGISIANSENFEIKNNRVIDCYKEGINTVDGSRNGKVHGNFVSNAVRVGFYSDAFAGHQYNIEYYNNIAFMPDGVGFAAADEYRGKLENITFRNNIVYDSQRGFSISPNSEGRPYDISGITFKNNVAFHSKFTGVFISGKVTDVLIENNIFYQAKGSEPLGIHIHNPSVTDSAEISIRNNLFQSAASSKEYPKGTGSKVEGNYNKVMIDPTGELTGKRDFRLAAASPGKGTGYKGVDMGILEK